DRNACPHGGARRNDPERRIQAAVHMHDVEALLAEQRLEPRGESPADGNPRHAAVRIDHQTRPYSAHVRGIDVTIHAHVRGHYRRMMAEGVQLPGEMMHVLGHATELRVVVLRDERDPQRRHRALCSSRSTAETTAAGRSSWRLFPEPVVVILSLVP